MHKISFDKLLDKIISDEPPKLESPWMAIGHPG